MQDNYLPRIVKIFHIVQDQTQCKIAFAINICMTLKENT
jgi:hypothetical protein